MPLSRPYGVTRLGWRSHVSRETLVVVSLVFRAPCGVLAGRAAWCARGRRPAREPSAPRAFGSARRLEARPGPATAHGHRSQALRSLRRPPHRRHLVCWPALALNLPTGTASGSSNPGGPRGVLCAASPVSNYGLHGVASNRGISLWRCVGRARSGGAVPRARDGMQKVRSP